MKRWPTGEGCVLQSRPSIPLGQREVMTMSATRLSVRECSLSISLGAITAVAVAAMLHIGGCGSASNSTGAAGSSGGRGGASGAAGTGGSATGGSGMGGGAAGTTGGGGTTGVAGGGGTTGVAGSGGTTGVAGSGGTTGVAGSSGGGTAGGRGGGPGGTGGGGSSLTLTSTQLTEGATFMAVNTCAGDNHSPPLTWTGTPPSGTMSYAVVLLDTSNSFNHWAIFDIPTTTTSLPEDLPTTATLTTPVSAKQRGVQGSGYFGPCPNGQNHIYRFTVYAIDVATLPGITASSTPAQVVTAIMQHDLASGSLSGMSNASM